MRLSGTMLVAVVDAVVVAVAVMVVEVTVVGGLAKSMLVVKPRRPSAASVASLLITCSALRWTVSLVFETASITRRV